MIADLLLELRRKGCSPKTSASALATLHSIIRYARRHGWITIDPIDQLEPEERPRAVRRRQRVLGRAEIERLLAACPPPGRLMLATALYSGLRISEMLGLVWDDVDLTSGVIHVRLQLSRAHREMPARRVPTKTPASVREIPLVPQLAHLLAAHKQATPFAADTDWVLPPPVVLPTDTATSLSGYSNAPPAQPDSTKTAGRRCAFTICAIPLPVT